jgi:hypothetical protein
MPGGPLVFVPVVRPADPACFLRMPGSGPVAIPAIDRGLRDPARRHVGTADHRAPVNGRNGSYLLAAPHPLRRPGRPRPGFGPGRPGHLIPPAAASLGDDELEHLQSRASSVALDASGGAFWGVAGPGGRTGPLPRRCSQCHPPGRARRPPLPPSADRSSPGSVRVEVDLGRGRSGSSFLAWPLPRDAENGAGSCHRRALAALHVRDG